MSSQIDTDAMLVMHRLYTWIEGDNDENEGRYSLSKSEILESTKLPDDRLEDAVEFLGNRDQLKARYTLGGLQQISPTVEGRRNFQEDQSAIQFMVLPNMYDVFLSHSAVDDQLSGVVKNLLEQNGIKTFATPGSIESGKWEPQIEEALQQSQHIWVLLTPAALGQSIWVHQELGYFYGFGHGRGEDPKGNLCRYLFTSDTVQPGLYRELQGTPIDSFEDPRIVAEAIANGIGRDFEVPSNYDGELIRSSVGEITKRPALKLRQDGSEGHAESSTQTVGITIETDVPIYNIQAVAFSKSVSVSIEKPYPQLDSHGRLPLLISWQDQPGDAEPFHFPTEVLDPRNRLFTFTNRPNDPGNSELLAITFDTQDDGPIAALTYFTVATHQKGFPDFQLIGPGAPFGWVKGVNTREPGS